jgi:hypothetical protein
MGAKAGRLKSLGLLTMLERLMSSTPFGRSEVDQEGLLFLP